MKECNCCKVTKPFSEFGVKKSTKDGYYGFCRQCKAKKDKEYREANKDKLKDKYIKKYKDNKEEILAKRRKQYNEATPEEVKKRKEAKRIYSQNAPEEVKQRKKEYDKKYFASEAGKITTMKSIHKRRAQKLSSEDGTVTSQALDKLKEEQNHQCKYCKCELDFSAKGQVHLDHVIPLSKGGAHSITNVVWSCAKCNLKKSDKLINVEH